MTKLEQSKLFVKMIIYEDTILRLEGITGRMRPTRGLDDWINEALDIMGEK